MADIRTGLILPPQVPPARHHTQFAASTFPVESSDRKKQGGMTAVVVDGLIFQRQAYGGISRITRSLLEHITRSPDPISIDVLLTGPVQAALPAPPVRSRVVSSIDRAWPVSALLRQRILSRYVDRHQIWHSFYYSMPHDFRGQSVITVYDMTHEQLRHLFRGAWFDHYRRHKARTIRRASAIVCVSHATRTELLNRIDIEPARVQVIPLAVDPAFIDTPESAPPDKPFLLYVGGRHAYKNFGTLLRAFAASGLSRDLELNVVGPPASREEIERVHQLGIAAAVKFSGSVDDTSLAGLYRQATALVYPSYSEGFGLPVLEAMACGCPVVASRIPSTEEVAGAVPFYFEPADVEGLIAALHAAIAEGRSGVRREAALSQAQRYSWAESAKRIRSLYASLEAGSHG